MRESKDKRLREVHEFMIKYELYTSDFAALRLRIEALPEPERRFALRARPLIQRLRAANLAHLQTEKRKPFGFRFYVSVPPFAALPAVLAARYWGYRPK